MKSKKDQNEKESTEIERYKETVLKSRHHRGRRELLKHLDGKRLTPKQAILAKCFDCTGGYADGRADCEVIVCPLYQYMPFGKFKRKSKSKKKEGREK